MQKNKIQKHVFRTDTNKDLIVWYLPEEQELQVETFDKKEGFYEDYLVLDVYRIIGEKRRLNTCA